MRKANALSLLALAILVLPHGTLAPADAGQKIPFEGCGTLIEGVICILLEVPIDSPFPPYTTTYVPDDIGDFSVGDRVFVTGEVDPSCVSVCQQGSCLTVASIGRCPLVTDAQSFGSIKARFGRD